MRIDELKPNMVFTVKYDYSTYDDEGNELPPGRLVYRVPETLTFERKKEGWGDSARRVRRPVLEVYRITYIDHDDCTVSTKVERYESNSYPRGLRAIAGRDLNFQGEGLSEVMAKFGRERTEQRLNERGREEVSERCYQALKAVEALTGWHSRYLDPRTNWHGEPTERLRLQTADVSLEALEELIAMAQTYNMHRED